MSMSQVYAQTPEAHQDHTGAKIGMWLFLFTELLLFGGLFLLYAVYRTQYPNDFHYAAGELDSLLGAVNTVVLLTSSLTMALSITAMSRGQRVLSAWLLVVTILCGAVFLVIKTFEWSSKIEHHLYPNSLELIRHTPGENIFYGLYYAMTGLHGVHVVVGMCVLGVMLWMVARKPRKTLRLDNLATDKLRLVGPDNSPRWEYQADGQIESASITVHFEQSGSVNEGLFIKLENCGLYWHLVDVIWIFLFPLFYLIS